MSTLQKNDRRDVRYSSLDELRGDVERLAAGPVQTVGNWSFGQILSHLARTINFSFDGFPFQSPWLVRKLVTLFFKRRFLHKKMPSGFKLPARARSLIPEDEAITADSVAMMLAAIDRLQQESPTAAHPVFGQMTPDEWRLLHLRHCELHMSFARAEGE